MQQQVLLVFVYFVITKLDICRTDIPVFEREFPNDYLIVHNNLSLHISIWGRAFVRSPKYPCAVVPLYLQPTMPFIPLPVRIRTVFICLASSYHTAQAVATRSAVKNTIITGKILRKDRSGAADAAPLLNRYHFCTFFIDTENAEREWADSKIRQCPGPAWPRPPS